MENNQHGKGCLPSKKDIRDYTIKKNIAKSCVYPTHFECEKRAPIKDQGMVGSCVAHSAAEILEYHEEGAEKLSTNFLYGIHYKLYGTEGPGMYVREVCKIAKKYGDPQYSYCPGNTEIDEVYDIALQAFNNPEAMEDAKKHRISSYAKLVSNNDIKYALMEYGPIIGSIKWYDDNTVDKATGILTKGQLFDGNHAIVVYGWNQDGWLCQNSWGVTWGKQGYFILPFSYGLQEAYSFVPAKNEDDLKMLKQNNAMDFIYKIINFFLNMF